MLIRHLLRGVRNPSRRRRRVCDVVSHDYAAVTVKAEAANFTAVPADVEVGAVSEDQPTMLPPLEASNSAKWVSVPQSDGVGAGKVMSIELLIVLVDRVQVALLFVTWTRAYALPDTSVPPPESLGAAVNRATYRFAGAV
jgi:hypothetical protein